MSRWRGWDEPVDGVATGPAYTLTTVATVQPIWTDEDGITVSVHMHTDSPLTPGQAIDLATMLDRAANSGPPLTEPSGPKNPDGMITERGIP